MFPCLWRKSKVSIKEKHSMLLIQRVPVESNVKVRSTNNTSAVRYLSGLGGLRYLEVHVEPGKEVGNIDGGTHHHPLLRPSARPLLFLLAAAQCETVPAYLPRAGSRRRCNRLLNGPAPQCGLRIRTRG
jgi:hypothetical protein